VERESPKGRRWAGAFNHPCPLVLSAAYTGCQHCTSTALALTRLTNNRALAVQAPRRPTTLPLPTTHSPPDPQTASRRHPPHLRLPAPVPALASSFSSTPPQTPHVQTRPRPLPPTPAQATTLSRPAPHPRPTRRHPPGRPTPLLGATTTPPPTLRLLASLRAPWLPMRLHRLLPRRPCTRKPL
jgi:hypothetical protein